MPTETRAAAAALGNRELDEGEIGRQIERIFQLWKSVVSAVTEGDFKAKIRR